MKKIEEGLAFFNRWFFGGVFFTLGSLMVLKLLGVLP